MTTILVTGSSRGIGAAIASSLGDLPDTQVLGHGTRSGIAADLSDPAAPRGSGPKRSTGRAARSTSS